MERSSILSTSNFANSLQVAIIGKIPSGTFSIDDEYGDKVPFLIKNIGDDNVTVSIVPAGGTEPVSTVVYPGWNVELVKEIRDNNSEDLQYGY